MNTSYSPRRWAARASVVLLTVRRVAVTLMALALPASALAEWGDSHYVPTPQSVVDKMLQVAKVGARDFVVDLGSGDGRIVITAATKFGARGFGVEIDPKLIRLSNQLAARAGVSERAAFFERDLYQTDLSPASVVTLYLLPEVVLMLRPKILSTLRPGTRVVSHDYDFGDWQPDHQVMIEAPDKPVGRDRKSKIMYWVVPAQAAGRWHWQIKDPAGAVRGFDLSLHQMFQKVEGTLTAGGKPVAIQNATLTGDQLAFDARIDQPGGALRYAFSGRLLNHAIDGTVRFVHAGTAPVRQTWSAARTEVWEPKHLSLPGPRNRAESIGGPQDPGVWAP